jgi:hypothetical protein
MEEVAFQKAAVARLKKEILGVDRNARRRYIKEFSEEFNRFDAVSSFDDLIIACYKADIVYIGDYHALPSSQEFGARLLRDIASRSKEVVLCMEMVLGRDQKALDRFMSGRAGEADFLKSIRYHHDWGYDWNSFRRLFEAARENDLPVIGIDCGPRTGFRYIRKRDTYAALRIADVIEGRPDAKIVVLIGESHLAHTHLPRKVMRALRRKGLQKRGVVVLQNLEEIYWRLVEVGLQQADVVNLKEDVYCHFNTSPIAKYEAYRHILEVWKGEAGEDEQIELTSTVHGLIDNIVRFLRVDKYSHCVKRDRSGKELLIDSYPEIYSSVDVDDIRSLLKASRFSGEEVGEILSHMDHRGSCYVPRINAIFIGQLSMVHAGEEAAHFVNLALKGEIYGRAPRAMPQHDLFYTGVMEEALGFFGSKLIDPSRNHFFETEFYQYYRKDREIIEAKTPYRFEEFNAIINFILLHKKFEQSYENYSDVPAELLDGIRAEPGRANILVHELGYFLGQQIYDAYRAGKLDRAKITRLFKTSFYRTGSALRAYLDLTRLVGGTTPGAPGLRAQKPQPSGQ